MLPDKATYIITIDPASSDAKGADDQVVMLLALWGSRIYVVEYTAEKGEMPEVVGQTIMQWIRRYPILGIWSESVGYQRVLAHYLESEMRLKRQFVPVHRVQDQRRKSDRIMQSIGSATGYGLLYVRETHGTFLTQYYRYSPRSREHDDILDALAIGIDVSKQLGLEDAIEGEYTVESRRDSRKLEFRRCP